MPQPITRTIPPIQTRDEWNTYLDEQSVVMNDIAERAKKEQWSNERLYRTMADASVTYDLAFHDPRSIIPGLARKVMLEATPGSYELKLDNNPGLKAEMTRLTAMLNAEYGVNFPPPPILILPIDAPSYAPEIDAVIFNNEPENGETWEQYYATIAHEMRHRYQFRDPEHLRAATYGMLSLDTPETQLSERNAETDADLFAAKAYSPQQVYNMMKAFTGEYTFWYYVGRTLNITPEEAANKEFTAEQLQSYADQFIKLPKAKQEAIHMEALRYEDSHPHDLTHPSKLDRMELQYALMQYPELLNARKLNFDGDANIISVEGGSRVYTPQQLQAINKDADIALGVRK